MAKGAEIRQQTAWELDRRHRLAVPAFAAGVLYLLSSIVITATLNGAPTVGLLEGISPALRGEADPARSPRTDEVKFISHHAFPLISGSVMAAVAILILVLVLLLLFDATRFRRPGIFAPARPLVLYGGIAFATISIAHQVVGAILTHKFATGQDFSTHAVEHALTKGTPNLVVQYLSLLAGLALAAGMIATMMAAQRVGLVPRWVGILGIFSGLLLFIPIGGAQLQIIPAFFLVMMGILLIGKWPGGDPPAWEAGEARPWPTAAEQRAEREAKAGKLKPAPAGAGAPAASESVPEPRPPVESRSQRRKRRKSGGKH
jgi:hypothetical protein